MSSDVLKRLGTQISHKSKAKFKTKIDFAFECDVDERTIRRILKGEQNISIHILKRICDTLDIKMSDLLRDINE